MDITGDKKAYLLNHIADTQNNNQVAALSQDGKLDQIAEKMSRLVYEKLAAEQKYVFIISSVCLFMFMYLCVTHMHTYSVAPT